MEIYLDNSATTKVSEGALQVMLSAYQKDYGNPSSMHVIGVRAEEYVKTAAENIAATLKAEAKEIIFTSGGTESNNLAIIGAARAYQRRGKHIITTQIEHPAVHEPFEYLKEQGYEIDYIPVDSHGMICMEMLQQKIRQDTILVSVMHVNNEMGAVQKLEEISKEIKKLQPEVLFHVDAIQSYGKYQIHPKRQGIDLMSISSHKIHGPKGVGVLYVRKGVRLLPILFGGGQQGGIRSGTENVPGIAGLGKAAKEAYEDLDTKINKLYELKLDFIKKLIQIDKVSIHGFDEEELSSLTLERVKETAPHIVNVSFFGIRSEVMLHALEENSIYVSAGSACNSNHPKPSATLTAMGLSKKEIESAIRFSFSVHTTKEELTETIKVLTDLVPILRRFTRK